MLDYVAHVDMDAFFANIEQASNPYLRGKPIIVTGRGLRHSVVTTASYEAKGKGVRSGMPAHEALKLCPEAILVEADSKKYEYVSKEVMKLLGVVSPRILVTSIDEAYVDLSHFTNFKEALSSLKSFKSRLMMEFGLTASIGVAPNPILAKIGSDFKKPDGFVVIYRGAEKKFLKNVRLEDIPGIGPHTLIKLASYGFEYAYELLRASEFFLYTNFGNTLVGLVKSLVADNFSRDEFFRYSAPKSIGHSMTFSRDVYEEELLKRISSFLGAKVIYRMRKKGYEAAGVSMFLKYADFSVVRTSRRLNFPVSSINMMNRIVHWLTKELWSGEPVRAIGVSCNRLRASSAFTRQLSLLNTEKDMSEVSLKPEELFDKYSLFPASILAVSGL
ncbi:DNA polymerase Y family protein [Kosmotoga pacifica]|uniref:DNA polymerase IV n=1 Tax=Kosmotoga pacifica TaxID=1330330 RepID=A0A0G2ZAV8_9BACT|nr:DNA polymerase IV [Kosmotoga pacifica]AKI97231.1 DNA polymerase [Kosmotoga pacifica]